ncbi:TetR/AcrR family transcriptional regulator [Nonomuraea lactucae]|uniref:TetR/AcrR family transcriptional regulator n=1 Tax=Nonomuraea lactucae TaxID=2249762 RepID=UPI000DE26BE8|nr:TetR/AcrR family transcriptional regulator [Nonomuraea lactucae]
MDENPKRQQGRQRRLDALTASKIVDAAITILDSEGEEALTARTLAQALATGPGAIYHHLKSKQAILAAAAAELVTRAISRKPRNSDPGADIRALMLTLFDTIDEHPWVGAQLTDQPGQPALLELFESIGEHLDALRIARPSRFMAASALVNYVLGVASQYAAAARHARQVGRTDVLADIADDWRGGQRSSTHPFAYSTAHELAEHDERQQFITGVEFLLVGITVTAQPS